MSFIRDEDPPAFVAEFIGAILMAIAIVLTYRSCIASS